MKIILGVFSSSFYELRNKYQLTDYGTDWESIEVNEHYHQQTDCWDMPISGVISKVHFACLMAEEIYFDITHVRENLDNKSFEKITLNELLLVITDKSYLNKTTFFRNGIEIPKDEVINWFLFNEYWDQFLN